MDRIRVLLVDDEKELSMLMAEHLGTHGLDCEVALSGEAALTVLEKGPPDIVILDMKMPGMGGMEVLDRVKDEYPEIPVIIMTGLGSNEGEVDARRLGAFDYLRKPVNIADLLETVRRTGLLPEMDEE